MPRFNRNNIDWDAINEAERLLKDAGFESVCGAMVSDPFSGDVPAYDSNFGTTYLHHWDSPSESEWSGMTDEAKTAWWEVKNSRPDMTISITLNYVSANDIIAALN